jgi:hypothetical protein
MFFESIEDLHVFVFDVSAAVATYEAEKLRAVRYREILAKHAQGHEVHDVTLRKALEWAEDNGYDQATGLPKG